MALATCRRAQMEGGVFMLRKVGYACVMLLAGCTTPERQPASDQSPCAGAATREEMIQCVKQQQQFYADEEMRPRNAKDAFARY
jgi:hypothetical protein